MKFGSAASFFKRVLISALGVLIGGFMLEGITYDDNASLVVVALLLGLFSAILRPILVLLALPFVIVTLGFGLLIINALLYLLTANLVDGFYVSGFGSAFFGALIITFLNMILSGWISGPRDRIRVSARRPASRRRVSAKDEVIDI